MTSDAYATACMVKGLESSLTWIETLKDIEAYFIYIGENSTLQAKFTTGFTNYLSAE
jgi:thiamine biosynthesis lipoprotein